MLEAKSILLPEAFYDATPTKCTQLTSEKTYTIGAEFFLKSGTTLKNIHNLLGVICLFSHNLEISMWAINLKV